MRFLNVRCVVQETNEDYFVVFHKTGAPARSAHRNCHISGSIHKTPRIGTQRCSSMIQLLGFLWGFHLDASQSTYSHNHTLEFVIFSLLFVCGSAGTGC